MVAAPGAIDVIVACHNASTTIIRALDSALAAPQVRCVIVADDASQDGTPDLVESRYPSRVTVLRAACNAGPAAARNRAIEHVQAPWFAILDSDDFFLPGRFDAMPPAGDFDIWADNILFTNTPDRAARFAVPAVESDGAEPIDIERFLLGNLSNFRRRRHQLGFCKPVFDTAFFRACGARYDEGLRLGEDFVLVLGLLLAGARFRFTRRCGYVAVERSDSLSARHGLAELAELLEAEEQLFRQCPLDGGARRAFAKRIRETRCKVNHMQTLARRRQEGVALALAEALFLSPRDQFDMVGAIAMDKLHAVLAHLSPPTGSFGYYLQPQIGSGA
ncbi:succinoglycan biosynthesis protein ExoU [Novosphingobium sp. PhB165]|uniref:glycosyltransferase family 2 protein n=1 Tax=Novosphingobium sp. PhB165 TaxID=2485105 RepID=UPI00104F5517|nr:glycosyltransferase family 2 protein [Novosphingobium sp. PhB165]TCM17985.1 succinoglycan biosynthesis protein ExoU [Novosphingobium sp. PhB165]